MSDDARHLDAILNLSDAVRYAAIYRNGSLSMRSRSGTSGASSQESDKYEELLVNPTILKLASQRGDIDCGGLDYLIIRYGNFFQFVLPMPWGHVSVCLEPSADAVLIGQNVISTIQNQDED